MDAIEAMETCRAMRYLRPDPVPEPLLRQLLRAASCASSPGNSQAWEFVVLRDPERKRRIGAAIGKALLPRLQDRGGADATRRRMLDGLVHLLEHFEDVPAIVFVCGRNVYPPEQPDLQFLWSALYPAAQNLIVAARSLGLGSVFTTLHRVAEPEVRSALGVPEEVHIGVTIPLGYPARRFGPLARRPLEDVVHWDAW